MLDFTPDYSYSLFYYYYVFLDTEKYLADQLFINHRVKVNFGEEFIKEGTPYRFICCKIRKKDEVQFIAALGEMDNKALLLGYEEYSKYCGIFDEMLAEKIEDVQRTTD
ncbi:MAG: hypothetical protein J6B85_14085 [Lachnospiraceae bacterium]|nr:hypothetical protein [Lachnospiraceae bacterium]